MLTHSGRSVTPALRVASGLVAERWSVTETAGCLRNVLVWVGEAPAEPGPRNRHSVRLARRLALPKKPRKLKPAAPDAAMGNALPCIDATTKKGLSWRNQVLIG